MTQGRKALRRIQIRAESTPGTRATPRFLWRGMGVLNDTREVVEVEETVGIFDGTDRTYIPKLMGEMELEEVEATFEQLSWLFLAAGLGTANGGGYQGSALGASGSAVEHLLAVPTSASLPTRSYTVEAGDGEVEAEVMPYGLVSKLSLKGAGGEAVKVGATLMGRYVDRTNDSGTFSAAGTLVGVETILAAGSFWLTSPGSAFGTGLVPAGNILGFSLDFEPMWEPKFAVDSGTTYFHTAVFTGMKITGEVTMEHQISGTFSAAGSAGQVTKWRNQQAQLLRMEFRGGTIPIGTTYQNKLLRVDIPIKFTTFDPLGDQNGNSIRVGKFFSKYAEDTPTVGRGSVTIVQRGTALFDGA